MCGFIGIYGSEPGELAQQLLTGLVAIQHRGQDAAGALTWDGRSFHTRKGGGLVRDVFSSDDIEALAGYAGIGHVRYPTVGLGSDNDAQPFDISYPFGIGMAHNGNVTNFDEIREDMSSRSHWHVNSSCDLEGILKVFGDELASQRVEQLKPEHVFRSVEGVFERVRGAYSVVGIVAGEGMYAFRDPYGIKPIIVGRRQLKDGSSSWCVASESVLMDVLDFHETFDLAAGEAIFIDRQGVLHRSQLTQREHSPCLFEYVYFARPDSFLDRVSVYKARIRMGELMAPIWQATGWHADVIIPVPESATTSAQAMARALDMKYREGLVKNRYIGRTFIMASNAARKASIRAKLNSIQLEFEGKDVLLVDDSIVRGNTSRQIVELARRAGARKVYFASVSPALRYPCIYGIDMSTKNEFVARDRDEVQIAREIGADGVVYQALPNLIRSVCEGNPEIESTCNACFSGHYPTGDVDEARLSRIEQERLVAGSDAQKGP
ncbi:MAG: amidophosphoribosyltransferase [Planctomycetota bacterium]|nr:MAG: amidophosphoribosyltransferase [Planctomycetota bacterium]